MRALSTFKRRNVEHLQLHSQLRSTLIPILRQLGHQAVDNGLQTAQVLRQLRNRLGDMFDAYGDGGIRVVRHGAYQQVVEHHPEAVEVRAVVHRVSLGLFGAHVVRRPQGHTGLRDAEVSLRRPGDTEIHQHRVVSVRPQENVFGFDVPVDVALSASEIQRLSNVEDDLDFLREGQLLAGLFQVGPGDVLHRQIIGTVVHADVVDGDDIGLNELADDTRFAQKPLAEAWIFRQGCGHDFEGDVPLEYLLHGEVNRRHAALTQHPFYPVSRYFHGHTCPAATQHCGR